MAATDIITSVNTKIKGAFTGINVLNIIGWIVFIIILIGAGWWILVYYKNKKQYNKRITAFDMVGEQWTPVIRDVAKTVKIGKGGFEILYLKKCKTWKIAYGGRVGKADYYFFIMPDGYWYNGALSANVHYTDSKGGLITVITTNPLMRGQYTSLEKQIDSIHGEKQKWWDKYGTYAMSVAFILIAGVMLWLMFKEFHAGMGELASYHTKLGEILGKLSNLASNVQSGVNSGLTPA